MFSDSSKMPQGMLFNDIVKNFDAVLGGLDELPENKGIHVGNCHKNEYVEISFPRSNTGRDITYMGASSDTSSASGKPELSSCLTEKITEEEKNKSASLTLILKQEGLLRNLTEIEYKVINDPISSENWQIETGPKITIRIPVDHIDLERLSDLAEQRQRLEAAEEFLMQLVKAIGICETKVRGYGVYGITFNNPGYAAGLSCDLCEETLNTLEEVKEALKTSGLRLESLHNSLSENENGAYVLRFDDPYDEKIIERLEIALNQILLSEQSQTQ